MTDSGRALACACTPELLAELLDAARRIGANDVEVELVDILRLNNIVRSCEPIIAELAAGRVRLEPVEDKNA